MSTWTVGRRELPSTGQRWTDRDSKILYRLYRFTDKDSKILYRGSQIKTARYTTEVHR